MKNIIKRNIKTIPEQNWSNGISLNIEIILDNTLYLFNGIFHVIKWGSENAYEISCIISNKCKKYSENIAGLFLSDNI